MSHEGSGGDEDNEGGAEIEHGAAAACKGARETGGGGFVVEFDVPGGGGAGEEDGDAGKDEYKGEGVGEAVVLERGFDVAEGASEARFGVRFGHFGFVGGGGEEERRGYGMKGGNERGEIVKYGCCWLLWMR